MLRLLVKRGSTLVALALSALFPACGSSQPASSGGGAGGASGGSNALGGSNAGGRAGSAGSFGGAGASGASALGGSSSAGSGASGSAGSSGFGGSGGSVTSFVRCAATGSAGAGHDGMAGAGNADGSVSVSATVTAKQQTLEGFGASLAWYQDNLVKHPQAAQLYPLLFADLGLDILRLRNRFQRAAEVVDLNVEKTVLARATESLGHAPKVLMTSWSPPAALKASGKEKCTGDAASCTLIKTNGAYDYAGFAKYWSDSLDAYAALGIKPDYISIQNETDFVPNGWEGCRFEPNETSSPTAYPGYDQALKAVSDKLAGRIGAPQLLGPETLGVHWNRLQNYVPKLDASRLYGWAHHLYEKGSGAVWLWQDPGPDAFLTPMLGALQVEQGKPIFMTEFQTDEDTLTSGGFETGWLMHNSLSDGRASAWLYWNLVWAKPGGLVALDDTGYSVRDQYYALRHYSKYTEPGDSRVDVSSNWPAIRATAWLAPNAARLTFVLLNVGSAEKTVRLAACDFASSKSKVVRTLFKTDGSSKRWEELGAYADATGLVLPARSMATVVFER